ncbi:hypothetical protein [Actinospica robiniae]|uniref:hypothetical protein n=1 Tax=Actinospica robiniae TaxID=304901 RepID=UPI000401E98F|nr:hypothetical protein [Actinospica robiniae]
MEGISDRINAVLANRRIVQPLIDAELAMWERIQDSLGAVRTALAAAQSSEVELAGLADFDVDRLARLAADSIAALASVRARVSRRTVNIGVSGQARNGKSTLLQALSGLGNEQIPARGGGAVTAVRSRILHSATQREALLTMHTEASFCTEVLAPYAAALGLEGRLDTLDSLAGFRYADHLAVIRQREDFPVLGPMLKRVQEMASAVSGFRPLLTGETRRIDLDELYPWVAYPPESTPDADRRYLAVRDAVISCLFPLEEVVHLGLIDLPGLGELLPSAEQRHLSGLQNDVDFVLVVKWPRETNTLWSQADARSLELIGQARGAAGVRDFAAILINTGLCTSENLKAVEDDVLHRLNDGQADSVYRVIRADAADREQVRVDVLEVLLAHLAEALPRMDAAALEQARAVCAANADLVRVEVGTALSVLRSVITATPTELLVARADGLRTDLAGALRRWVDGLAARAAADSTYEDHEFLARAEEIRDGIRDWVIAGFGEGVESWANRALDRMNIDASAAPFAVQSLNSVRVEIAEQFAGIDTVLMARRDEFWQGLADALASRLAPLLPEGGTPGEALQRLADLLGDAEDPCPTLRRALEFILDVRLDYRTRTLPRLRQSLYPLQAESASGDEGALARLLPVARTQAGAEELHRRMAQLARQTVHDASGILVDEPAIIAQVLFAYGEQFEDSFIRSKAAEAEFRRVAEAFRDQLWSRQDSTPGGGLANMRIQRVRKSLADVKAALASAPTSSAAVSAIPAVSAASTPRAGWEGGA